jgi:hypothetical protein
MTDACELWASLSDREAVGDWLAPQELDFVSRHVRECDSCRAEAQLFRALRGVLDEPESLTAPLSQPKPESSRFLHGVRDFWSQRSRTSVAFCGVAAVAAGLVMWLASRGEQAVAARPAGPSRVELGARIGFVSGEVFVNGQRPVAGRDLAAGDSLETGEGQACLMSSYGVTVCAGPDTELSVKDLRSPERRLKLESGHVVARLERQQPGTSFGIETRAGAAVAKGTLFAVEASGEDVWVRVHEGTVISGGEGRERPLVAPGSVRLAAGASAGSLSDEQRAYDSRLIRLTEVLTNITPSTLEVMTSPAGAAVTIDDTLLGTTPVSAFLEPGAHHVGVEQAGFSPIAEQVRLREGERLLKSYELVARAESVKAGVDEPERAPAVEPQSAPVLLAEARQHRQNGRFSEARTTYQELLRRYPGSAEARASLVSLGELQLSQLNDARGALTSFDTYLRGGGALAQEARFGRIRALRSLGRHDEERAAIRSYLADYPRSVQAAALRARLGE